MAEHIITVHAGSWHEEDKERGCGECQASCQSACKTSCTVGNQACLREGEK